MEDYFAHIVRQGEYLVKLAWQHGFDLDDVWNHPKNAALKAKRNDNHHILEPGDVLYIPMRKKEGLPPENEALNNYTATVPKVEIRLVFLNLDKPRANEQYVVMGLGDRLEGTTGGDGEIKLEVPVHVRELEVIFRQDYVAYSVRVGDMDPIETFSGARKRLKHLGHYDRWFGDDWNDVTEDEIAERDSQAIIAFQSAQRLKLTGQMDEETKAALSKEHGS